MTTYIHSPIRSPLRSPIHSPLEWAWGGAEWTPLSLGARLAGWWDLSDASTVHATGSLIDSVDDKSGNGFTLTSSSTARPSYGATVFQSHKPGMTLDGSNDWLSVSNLAIGTSEAAVFSFGQFTTTDTFPQILHSYLGTGDSDEATDATSARFIWNGGDSVTLNSRRSSTSMGFTDGSLLRTQPGVYLRMGIVFDGANRTLYRDGVSVATAADASGAFKSTGLFSWGANSGGGLAWPGIQGECIVVKGALSTSEIALIDSWFLRHWTKVVICEGDSVTWATPTGANISYAYRAIPNLSPQAFVMNMATPGIGFDNFSTDIANRFATRVEPFVASAKANGKQCVLSVLTLNNVGGPLNTAAAAAASYGTYAAAAKAAGVDKVVFGTPLSRTDGQANDTLRGQLLTIMRGTGWAAANSIDAIADFAADAIMGVDAAPTVNSAYFADDVHPNAAGHELLEPIWTAAINSL